VCVGFLLLLLSGVCVFWGKGRGLCSLRVHFCLPLCELQIDGLAFRMSNTLVGGAGLSLLLSSRCCSSCLVSPLISPKSARKSANF